MSVSKFILSSALIFPFNSCTKKASDGAPLVETTTSLTEPSEPLKSIILDDIDLGLTYEQITTNYKDRIKACHDGPLANPDTGKKEEGVNLIVKLCQIIPTSTAGNSSETNEFTLETTMDGAVYAASRSFSSGFGLVASSSPRYTVAIESLKQRFHATPKITKETESILDAYSMAQGKIRRKNVYYYLAEFHLGLKRIIYIKSEPLLEGDQQGQEKVDFINYLNLPEQEKLTAEFRILLDKKLKEDAAKPSGI